MRMPTGILALCVPMGAMGAAGGASWDRLYEGTDATGPQVIALWQFLPGRETEDSSGHGHGLSLRGASTFSPAGRFGSCLESHPAGPDRDHPVGAQARDHDALSPAGAFTLELWLKPKKEMGDAKQVFLVDKKYFHYAKDVPQANTDYCFYLERSGPWEFRLRASLGFGTDSVWSSSRPVPLAADTWVHLAFTYDGAGVSRFFVDGEPVGKAVHEGRGAVTPGSYALTIGDRVGSTHVGCPGTIDQVRLCNGVAPAFAGALTVGVQAGRTVFRRLETSAAVAVVVENDTSGALEEVTYEVLLGETAEGGTLGRLAAGQSQTLTVPVDTRLRAGVYPLRVTVTGRGAGGPLQCEASLEIRLVPRPPPDRMPVVMWGGGNLDTLQSVGFTHQLEHLVDYARVWEAGAPTTALDGAAREAKAERLNTYLARGLGACVYVYPGRWVGRNEKLRQYLRVDRSGTPTTHANVSASHPDLQAYGYHVGASVARTFGSFPALSAALIHSEIRDGTSISFHDFEREAARLALGFDIPPLAAGKNGVHFRAIPGFPANRVVADDNPILRFYRWFWREGDGWNDLHSRVHEGLKFGGRDDLWTFFDPAVRVPSVWGSGGSVDVISQWTYSYPDPIKIGQATDELFAMAEGRPGQQVMKMTQAIWYRSGTAPELPADEAARAQWEKDIPDAKFITIAPDHLREAFWCMLSRPVRGIMVHGWGSLFPDGSGSYRYTHPETKDVLRDLVRDVVTPLGPTLLRIPDRPADVGVLQSHAAQVFAGRGSYGWSQSWEARLHLILQWASLQPRVLFDEHVCRGDLQTIAVLAMPHCDVLTATVAEAVQAFQRRGGLVIADEFLCPAITPDIVIPCCGDEGEAHERKSRMQAEAARLRMELDEFYSRYADSSNPDVIPRVRSYATTDYVFLVNDRRTYGDYVGHHRRVMEKGLPSETVLRLARARGHVYDLVAHREMAATVVEEKLSVNVALGPGEGRLLMVCGEPIRRVVCDVEPEVRRGESIRVAVRVLSAEGQPPAAVVPVEIEVLDASGGVAEGSGHYAAGDGSIEVALAIAPNDTVGRWRVRARELASGLTAEASFAVK
ncbi:MAG: hypothetical protein JXR77_02670 [Lentisphaeria bacterium]|nr:hypothetical protein [Lentisphaeria bacterium]